MGAESREVAQVEAEMEELKRKIAGSKSHLASIEMTKQLDALEKKKAELEKKGSNWIVG